jgi:Flp pilus assembly pilin Flp
MFGQFTDAIKLYLSILRQEEGQDLTEYALLLIFIAAVVVVGVTALGDQLLILFNDAVGDLGG